MVHNTTARAIGGLNLLRSSISFLFHFCVLVESQWGVLNQRPHHHLREVFLRGGFVEIKARN